MRVKYLLLVPFHIIRETYYTLKWYKWKKMPYNRTVVAVVDGRTFNGGMADRFKGIISLYVWAKQRNIPFRIQYNYPFNLTEFLKPNDYNWIPNELDYVQSIYAANVMCAYGERNVVNRLNGYNHKKQIHFYGNLDVLKSMGVDDIEWGKLFNELFTPNEDLHNKINHIKQGKGKYIAAVFRFQNLLGDFPEYHFKETTEERKKYLLDECLKELKNVVGRHIDNMCLVTSDSVSFLNKAKEIEKVFIVPGQPIHMGSDDSGTYENYEKSFLDFYMIAGSIKVYSVVIGDMYPSEFPLYASKLNNVPFERIRV